jgi:hypothetical protein
MTARAIRQANNLLTEAVPLAKSSFLGIIREGERNIVLPEFGSFDIKIRFTQQNAAEILNEFNYKPARISYSYVDNRFFFDQWFLTCGPRSARSCDLQKNMRKRDSNPMISFPIFCFYKKNIFFWKILK